MTYRSREDLSMVSIDRQASTNQQKLGLEVLLCCNSSSGQYLHLIWKMKTNGEETQATIDQWRMSLVMVSFSERVVRSRN
jgi:hypothetical protein